MTLVVLFSQSNIYVKSPTEENAIANEILKLPNSSLEVDKPVKVSTIVIIIVIVIAIIIIIIVILVIAIIFIVFVIILIIIVIIIIVIVIIIIIIIISVAEPPLFWAAPAPAPQHWRNIFKNLTLK